MGGRGRTWDPAGCSAADSAAGGGGAAGSGRSRLPRASRVSAQARTTPTPTAAPPTASLNVCAPMATMAAATAVAIRTARARAAAAGRRHPERRVGEQHGEAGRQRETAGGVPAGKGCSDGLAHGRLEHVVGNADREGHGQGRQHGSPPPAGDRARQQQRERHDRYRFQLAEVRQPVQQHGKPALLRLEPRVERRVEPARQPVAGETYPGGRDRRHAGRQQHHGRTAKRSGHERHQLMVCGRTGG